jgi:ABC-type transport system involved in Fe-S cluster assembly fused permease/ATPase subunit
MIIRMIFRFLTINGGAVLKKPTSPQNGKVQTLEKRIAVQIQNAGSLLRFIALGS